MRANAPLPSFAIRFEIGLFFTIGEKVWQCDRPLPWTISPDRKKSQRKRLDPAPMTNDPESEARKATWKLIADMVSEASKTSKTDDGLASLRVAQKLLTAVQQQMMLDIIVRVANKMHRDGARGEDYRLLLELTKDMFNLGGTHDQ